MDETSPTEPELELLKAFWRVGAMSAREAHAEVAQALNWAPSTTRTILERMRRKGLLARGSSHGLAVYSPVHRKIDVLGDALKRLVRGVLEIDGTLPAAAFAGSQLLSPEEIQELDHLLNDLPEEDA